MRLLKKLHTAMDILRSSGIKGVSRTIKAKMARPQPDEALIAYQLLSSTIKNGIMIDVGAHHGSSLAPFAQSGWQIFAFEPDSKNRAVLLEAYAAHSNVHVDPRALSDEVQLDRPFYASKESNGVSGLSPFLASHHERERVTVTTLEKALDEYRLLRQTIDFLKVDVEGFDLLVLKGYPWHHKPPRMVLCEFEDTKTLPQGYDFDQLAGFLIDKGYLLVVSEWYPIKTYGDVHRWRRFNTYPCKLADPHAWGNILAIKDRPMYDQLLEICGLLNGQPQS